MRNLRLQLFVAGFGLSDCDASARRVNFSFGARAVGACRDAPIKLSFALVPSASDSNAPRSFLRQPAARERPLNPTVIDASRRTDTSRSRSSRSRSSRRPLFGRALFRALGPPAAPWGPRLVFVSGRQTGRPGPPLLLCSSAARTHRSLVIVVVCPPPAQLCVWPYARSRKSSLSKSFSESRGQLEQSDKALRREQHQNSSQNHHQNHHQQQVPATGREQLHIEEAQVASSSAYTQELQQSLSDCGTQLNTPSAQDSPAHPV